MERPVSPAPGLVERVVPAIVGPISDADHEIEVAIALPINELPLVGSDASL